MSDGGANGVARAGAVGLIDVELGIPGSVSIDTGDPIEPGDGVSCDFAVAVGPTQPTASDAVTIRSMAMRNTTRQIEALRGPDVN
jgi:hypothetical protein